MSTHVRSSIYIATTDFVKRIFQRIFHSREVFPGRGFSPGGGGGGGSISEKWGLEFFWGKCLKRTRFSDIFIGRIVFPGEDTFA